MALILSNNKYVKFDINGNYLIYENEEARLEEKNATPYKKVIEKYESILDKFYNDAELRYYDPDFFKNISMWDAELLKYTYNYSIYNTTEKYPLIKKYIKDIEKTIPKIVIRGAIGIKANSLEELYQKVKVMNIFGDSNSIKDA